ncbi:MAG: hypothetical protein EOR84_35190 [Mesorhizobium sp.]|nr:MAG: hypothetical protein EOR84_35190 [Mesorhizobium sp.]
MSAQAGHRRPAPLAIAPFLAFAEWEEWANLVAGLWLIVSPWLLGFAANVNAMGTHVVLSVLVFVASVWVVWDHRRHPPAHA